MATMLRAERQVVSSVVHSILQHIYSQNQYQWRIHGAQKGGGGATSQIFKIPRDFSGKLVLGTFWKNYGTGPPLPFYNRKSGSATEYMIRTYAFLDLLLAGELVGKYM